MPARRRKVSAVEETEDQTRPGSAGDQAAVDAVIAAIGTRGMALSDDGLSIHLPGVIPTGSEWLDLAIGRGGWPLGRVSMLSGDEGAGKTTLALQACANAQRAGGIAVYVDAEYKLDRTYAQALGVDPTRLIVSQPDSMEQAFELIHDLSETFAEHRASTKVPMLFVYDSLNAFLTEQELAGQVDTPGSAARAMSKGLRLLVKRISLNRVALLMISQMRDKVGVIYGSKKSTSGGNAPKFYSTVIASLDFKQAIKTAGEKTGKIVGVEIGKNQIAPPFTKCLLSIRYGQGVDYVDSLHNALMVAGVVDAGKKGDEEDEKPRRRFGRREEEPEDGDVDEDAPKRGKKGGGWVTYTPPEGEPIRWQGPGGLRSLVADDRQLFRDLLANLRSRYGWDS